MLKPVLMFYKRCVNKYIKTIRDFAEPSFDSVVLWPRKYRKQLFLFKQTILNVFSLEWTFIKGILFEVKYNKDYEITFLRFGVLTS